MANLITRPAIFFGKILTPDLPHVCKVNVNKYVMDKRLIMYFNEKSEVYAFDKTKGAKEGDYVIIREIPESENNNNPNVKYNVENIVYELGNFIDPVTGRKCARDEYVDDIKKTTELFGRLRPYQKSDNNV